MRLNIIIIVLLMTLFTACTNSEVATGKGKENLKWEELPAVPDSFGFAGSFAGVSGDALLLAGGANFPDGGAPWTGSKKVWHSKVFALDNEQAAWKEVGQLPGPLGYGVSISWKNSLYCFGGSLETGHSATVLKLTYEQGVLKIDSLPAMPKTLANTCGAMIGNTVYIAGGLVQDTDKTSSNAFWSLDLSAPELVWKEEDSWPGVSRMLSVAGVLNNEFYLFSGAELVDGNRKYLKDAYRFSPTTGWTTLPELSQAVVAAPSLAYTASPDELWIFGGDTGEHASVASQLKENHPGFSTDILRYTASKNAWDTVGSVLTNKKADAAENPNGSTWAPVTTSLVVWNKNVIIPSGEVRPAVRTPRVLKLSIKE